MKQNEKQRNFKIGLSSLVVIGIIICSLALPYLQNNIHEKKTIYISALDQKVGWFDFKIVTNDLLVAGNPLDVSVVTAAMPPDITGIQLEFVGASQFFQKDYDFTSPDFFEKQYQDYQKALESNILSLEKSSLTQFSGELKNVKYGQGGDFDVGITIFIQNTSVGYGWGDTSYSLNGIIHVSPPEALIDYKNGNLTLGLTIVAVGLVFIALGLSGLIDFYSKWIGI